MAGAKTAGFEGHRRAYLIALAIAGLIAAATGQVTAQSEVNWTGAIRCEVRAQAPGYSHQETQTWTLTGGAPAVQGSVRVYPATWSVTGQGWHDRTRNASRRVAQWTVSVPGPNSPVSAPIGFTFHPTGGQFDITKWHAQLTAGGGYTGTDQFINNGIAQTPNRLVSTLYEWQFPKIEAATTETQLTGSHTVDVKAFVGPLQPEDAQAIVSCAWALGRGSAPALPPPTMQPTQPPTLTGTVSGAPVPAGGTGSGPTGSTAPGGVAAPPATTTTTPISPPPAPVPAPGPSPAPAPAIVSLPTQPVISPTLTAVPTTPAPTPIPASNPSPAPAPTTTATTTPVLVTTTSPTATTTGTTSPTATTTTSVVPTTTVSPNRTQAFAASGTFTVPDLADTVTVELWGAGAGGASSTSASFCTALSCRPGVQGHGGGGGAYTRIVLQVSSGMTFGIVVGTRGKGGAGGGCCARAGEDGTDGASTQLTRNGTVLAEAAGGKADGTGGRQSIAPDVVALAGTDGTPSGAGGAAVSGSITPAAATGGSGGPAPTGGCAANPLAGLQCDADRKSGADGGPGYALISWTLMSRFAP